VLKKKYWIANLLSILGGIVFAVQLWIHAHYQYSGLDEGDYAIKGLLFVTGKYVPFQDYGPWTNHMPLSFLIPGYIQVLFGPGLLTIRYFSIILAVLALVGIWITARRLGGYWWGTGAVWIFAISPAMSRFYSQSASQVLVFFMLAWMLAFALGENLPRWRLVGGSLIAGCIFLTRVNMAPVLVFLLGYIFWQYGCRTGLIASFAGLTIVAIGITMYWPGVLKFILNAFLYGGDIRIFGEFNVLDVFESLNPFRDVNPLNWLLLFLVVGIAVVFWFIREKYKSRPTFKSILWGGFFLALMGLYLWKIDGGDGERITTILTTFGIHLIIFLVIILGYFFWRKRGNEFFTSIENNWKYYFLLTAIECAGALVALFQIPSDPKNNWFLGYSPSRIGIISAALIFFILALWLTVRTWRNPSFAFRMQNWIDSWRQDRKRYRLILSFLLFATILGTFFTLQAIIITDLAIKAIFVRLSPFFILAGLIGVQTLLLISLGLKTFPIIRQFLFSVFSALVGVFVILHLDQSVISAREARSLNAAMRSHFIPFLGLIFMLIFWQGGRKWKKESEYRISVVVSALFLSLILVHMYATYGQGYCIHCLQPYFAFFSQLGVVLLIIVTTHLRKEVTKMAQLILILVILWVFTGLGYVVNSNTGLPLLAWAYLFITIIAGVKLIFTELQILSEYSLSAYLAVACIGIGFLLSPTILLGGGYQDMDCDTDIINYYETFGEELRKLIPEGSRVFWWGGSPVPLLYLTDRDIYPAQVNSTTYVVGGNTDELLREGRWNDVVGQQWLYESDYLIIKRNNREGWFQEEIKKDEFILILHKPVLGTCQRELEYLVYQHLP
jgi:hypothetical protein